MSNVSGTFVELPFIQYFKIFALNRRNSHGDRPQALEIIEKIVVMKNVNVPETYGLKGRIYKDKFIESIDTGGYRDYDSCEMAVSAYQVVFGIDVGPPPLPSPSFPSPLRAPCHPTYCYRRIHLYAPLVHRT